ncbi:MAG: flavodoxin family protein [Oscillospiraceae bacterium]|nr:flavodoxin family protein [Oscillospiraceae bacterium]
MKVLGINGSARRDGNTAIMINTAFEPLNAAGIETELVQLGGDVIQPCKACWACGGKENCVHSADNFRVIFDKMKQADGIILGSPVYCANISANMQALLERAAVVADMNRGLFNHKVGAAVAAARRGGALNTVDAMNHFFLVQDMYIVGSSYWGMAYGRMSGEVEQDGEGMETMRSLGRNMAHLLKALNERKA